jgi:chromosome segregation protein
LARQAVETRSTERKLVEGELVDARRELDRFNQRLAEIDTRLDERKTQLDKYRQSYQSAVSALFQAEKALQQSERKEIEAQQALAPSESTQREAESSLEKHRQDRDVLEIKLREVHEQIAHEQAAVAKVRAELQVLDQAENTLTGYASGARLLLEAARHNQVLGTRGTVSNHLDVPEDFEVAIAAALGEYLDAVLLESKANLERAIAMFEGQSARGSILPMDGLYLGNKDLARNFNEEILGFASDFVRTSSEYQAVVDLLLGRVLVVRDRKSAMKLLADGQQTKGEFDHDLRIVTLKEVFQLAVRFSLD